ncbi:MULTISPECIES: chromosomal replication initiator protein DnaA [unclassified Blautia]|uniref:chromosomal replication initiator protein DnaA n=1 Tax=unclassified Blautia TaxID=2648079 RepID=UPI000B393007|nr:MULTISPECIES: chromosomal replication initiator protein DnaA [unclassified Blautia]OUN26712.1 chromosomal replication initiator protein DnaA [Blautia sp. An81]OUN91374.1 chromosomal replication initiator protein DnaA [Blautia sp. An46]
MHIIQEKWPEILNMVKTEHDVSPVSFSAWLEPLEVYKVEGNVVTIVVTNGSMALNYINKKYLLPLQVAIIETTGEDYEISLVLPEDIKEEIPEPAPISDSTLNGNIVKAGLNPRYTFDTFVVGSNNKMAHAASLAVAESPGEAYNPLFIYGGVGLGKTHLMHSIAHFVLQKNPNAKVLYVTSETFTNELIDSIRNGNNSTMSKFREKYRDIDVLLIDDIQFIIGKESTQEEFFHTFNALHGAKKQIVISSDKPPKDMEILEDRLRSRFEWGLIVDISSPDYETRMAILRKKEELDGYSIDNEVIEYIARNVKSNIRELEGSLNKIMAYANLEKSEINLALAEKVLKDIISPNEKRVITPELITDIVAEHFDLTPGDIVGNKRNSKVVFPRQIVMYLCRHMTDTTLKNIGQYLGGRDHTTIMNGINKIEAELETSESTREVIDILKKKINPSKQ